MTTIYNQYQNTEKICSFYHKNRKQLNAKVRDIVNESSLNIKDSDFSKLSVSDVRCVINAIDKIFLGGYIKDVVGTNLTVQLSNRMTRSAGSVAHHLGQTTFLLKISKVIFLLPENVGGYFVNGDLCCTRLDALMSVISHELVHVLEGIFYRSSSHGDRFKNMARKIFGHSEIRHSMHTPNNRRDTMLSPIQAAARMFADANPSAAAQQATESKKVYVGATVEFKHGGRTIRGEVKRITKRATVISGDKKWYVPLSMLTVVVKKIIKVKLANLNG